MRLIILSLIFFPISKIFSKGKYFQSFLNFLLIASFPVKELFILVSIHINKLLSYVTLK